MKVIRIYADEAGDSHLGEIDVDMNEVNLTAESKILASKMFGATGVQFIQVREMEVEPHTAPRRQLVVLLSGEIEIEASDGVKRTAKAGDVVLAEDVTGKGHISRPLSDGNVLFIPVPDGL
jgi:hypothetical protein